MIIITSPSLDINENVSGISSVVKLIIDNNQGQDYLHFNVGRPDNEVSKFKSILRILKMYYMWVLLLVKHRDIDLIHFNLPLTSKSIIRDYVLLFFAKAMRFNVVLHIHGGDFLFKKGIPTVPKFILDRIFSYGYSVIVLSQKEKDFLSNKYSLSDVKVLPNSVEIGSVLDRDTSSQIEKLDILYIGRITEDKGVEYMLRAFEVLKLNGKPFTLHFAGIPDKTSKIEMFKKVLGDNFVYHGVVSGDKKRDLLTKTNIFILPSFYEGLPMSMLESMAYGLLPVVTNVGSIDTVVTNEVNGLFIDKKSVESIINKVNWILDNLSEVDKMSFNAQQTIIKYFSAENYILELNNIYNRQR